MTTHPVTSPSEMRPYHHPEGPRSRASGAQAFLLCVSIFAVIAVAAAYFVRDFF